MGEKRRKVYEALVEGATRGYSGSILYDYVLKRCPKAPSKKLVRASLLERAQHHLCTGDQASS